MALDRTDIGAVVTQMYRAISGPAGPRDWAAHAELFHPQSRQIRTWVDAAGAPGMTMMSRDGYREDTSAWFEANDFYEVETARRIDVFGNMAQVWSVYEARRAPEGELERRGINSIQLFRDADGAWSIMNMIWDNERPGVTVPA